MPSWTNSPIPVWGIFVVLLLIWLTGINVLD